MKLKLLIFTLSLLALSVLYSCTKSSTTMIGSWANPERNKDKAYHSIYIAALTQNIDAKTVLELSLADEVRKRKMRSVKSIDAMLPLFTKENKPTKEEMLKVLKDKNCDAIFIVTLLNTETESRYVPAQTTSYAPYPMYNHYGGWYNYYGYNYNQVYAPGYYTTDKKFYLESTLFDIDTETILWSGQSRTTNPASVDDFVKDYVKAVMDNLIDKGVAKKAPAE